MVSLDLVILLLCYKKLGLLFVNYFCYCLCGYIADNTSPMSILSQQDKTFQVKLGSKASCTFKYITNEIAALVPSKDKNAHSVDFPSILKSLKSSCISLRRDYWEYEICFGGLIRQIGGGDVYILGRDVSNDDTSQTYNNGDKCQAFGVDNKPRQTQSYFCL